MVGLRPSRRVAGGRAKVNQDRGCVVQPYGGDRKCALFAVFDGHGSRGEVVAQFCMNFVKERLAAHPTFASDLERALVDTFEACDAAMDARWAAEEKPPHVSSGTTAVVAVLRGNLLVVASVGDSRCVVATSDGDDLSGISLTTDHDPSLPVEKARITAAGGYVVDGRVFLDADGTQLGLAMSRSLGDRRLKAAGVVSTPTLQTRDVKADAYVVLATDGIWQVLGVDAVARALEGDEADAEYSCKNLIIEATALWGLEVSDYRDDITCMVVKCNPLTLTDVQASYVSVAAVRKHPVKERAPEPTSTRDVEVPRGQSIVLDTVGDGKYDTLGVDTSGDGRADTFGAPRLLTRSRAESFFYEVLACPHPPPCGATVDTPAPRRAGSTPRSPWTRTRPASRTTSRSSSTSRAARPSRRSRPTRRRSRGARRPRAWPRRSRARRRRTRSARPRSTRTSRPSTPRWRRRRRAPGNNGFFCFCFLVRLILKQHDVNSRLSRHIVVLRVGGGPECATRSKKRKGTPRKGKKNEQHSGFQRGHPP